MSYIRQALWFICLTTVLALALSTAYCAPSAYPDGFDYYDDQYSPYPSKQPQRFERINPIEYDSNTQFYTIDGRVIECTELPGNQLDCKEY